MISPHRRHLLQRVHLAKKDLGLSDDAYRDRLEQIGGKRSAAELSDQKLRLVVASFRDDGWQPRKPATRRTSPTAGMVAKATALWFSLYDLGVVRDPQPKALDAFGRRHVNKHRLVWCNAQDLARVIEALRDWCLREGYDAPETKPGDPESAAAARRALLAAQWRRLERLREVRPDPKLDKLDGWLHGAGWPRRTEAGLEHLAAANANLGHWLRRASQGEPKS